MSGNSNPSGSRSAIRRIAQYLEAHPHALDTIDGISRWWVSVDPGRVKDALAALERDRIVVRKNYSGQDYFGLDERCSVERLRSLVKQLEDKSS